MPFKAGLYYGPTLTTILLHLLAHLLPFRVLSKIVRTHHNLISHEMVNFCLFGLGNILR